MNQEYLVKSTHGMEAAVERMPTDLERCPPGRLRQFSKNLEMESLKIRHFCAFDFTGLWTVP